MSDAKWKITNQKTIATIRMWMDENIFHHVSTEIWADVPWKKLESLYESKSATNKSFLHRKLVNLKYGDGNSITEHLNEMKNITNQLASMNIFFDDELQALMLLSTLPDN